MVEWARRAVWWQVYPLGFVGAPKQAASTAAEPEHRLRRLNDWLPYIAEVGAGGLALGPVFASETHGYDTVDPYRVDPRLGDERDLLDLLDACHRRGLRVLLDGVFNHVGRGFAQFQDVLAHGTASPYATWFRPRSDDAGPGPAGYADFEGHHELVALNHAEPAVGDHVAGVMDHWLERGADGWRLDAAYAIPPAFLRDVLTRTRRHHPDAWFVGEVIHGDYTAFVEASGVDSVTQYELWKAIWSSLNDRNLFELAWSMGRHNDFARHFPPLTFVGNHDVTRIASRLVDDRHLGHALAVLFTVPGVPSVYYGDERALRGIKEERAGGDDAVRPAYPAAPDELPRDGEDAYRLHQRLIALRRRNPWLTGAQTEVTHLANQQLAYRSVNAPHELTVLLNLGDREHRFEPGAEPHARAEAAHAPTEDPWTVPAHSWAILAPASPPADLR